MINLQQQLLRDSLCKSDVGPPIPIWAAGTYQSLTRPIAFWTPGEDFIGGPKKPQDLLPCKLTCIFISQTCAFLERRSLDT